MKKIIEGKIANRNTVTYNEQSSHSE